MNTKALAAKFSYGDTVSHSEMDTFLGIVKPTYQGDIVKYEDEMKAYALTRLNRLEKFIEKLLKEEKIYLVLQWVLAIVWLNLSIKQLLQNAKCLVRLVVL